MTRADWLVPAGLILLTAIPALGGVLGLVGFATGTALTPDDTQFRALPLPIVLHIVSALPFCLLGAFQFAPGVRRRWPGFHRLSGRLVARRGARLSLAVAGGALLVASLMLTRLDPTTSTTYLLIAYFVFGLGSGLINPPITNTAVSGMPPSQAGVAAAIASTSRQVGMTLGVAVIGAISGGTISGAIGPSFAAATHAGWWICAGLAVLALLTAVATTGPWALQTARRTADRMREEEPAGEAPRARHDARELATH